MSSLLLFSAGGVGLVGAVLSLLLTRSEAAAKTVGCLAGIVSSALLLASGCTAIFLPATAVRFATPIPFADFVVRCDALGGLFLAVLAVLALTAWVYGMSYFDEYKGRGIGRLGFFMNLFVVSMAFVITVDNVFWFLVFFELMSLTSYFLVVFDQSPSSLRGGFLYFVMAHVGYLLIMVAFFIMVFASGGQFDFDALRGVALSPVTASVVFVCAFIGFGIKAGMVPFHSWLPLAHPAAPSNVSALMSGFMVKIGIFGIVKVCFDLLGTADAQLWWGLAVIGFGAVSAVFGIAYAIGERDIKKTLAYCTVENVGIILIGLGAAIAGSALDMPAMAAMGLLAALFHTVNHAMFKGAAFFGAGSLIYRTHTRMIDEMGGLARVMPKTAILFLIASVAICAIPPLNGFASEWYTFQSLLDIAYAASPVTRGFAVIAAAALAITGALAIVCFVKAYGVAFCGQARTDHAKHATEAPAPMTIANGILIVACVLLGLCASWVAPVVSNVAAASIGTADTLVIAQGAFSVNSAGGTAISLLLVAIILLAISLLLSAIRSAMRKRAGAGTRVEPWDCGYGPDASMLAATSSFAASTQLFYGRVYEARDRVVAKKSLVEHLYERFVAGVRAVEPVADRYLVDGVIKIVEKLGRAAQRLECGDYRIYIAYVVAALVVFLVLAVAIGWA